MRRFSRGAGLCRVVLRMTATVSVRTIITVPCP